jgi:hypothetical protein
MMAKVKMTISVSPEVADYLRAAPNASAVVAEAVGVYRAQQLEERLEHAYREDAAEAEELNREWEQTDAAIGR